MRNTILLALSIFVFSCVGLANTKQSMPMVGRSIVTLARWNLMRTVSHSRTAITKTMYPIAHVSTAGFSLYESRAKTKQNIILKVDRRCHDQNMQHQCRSY